MQSLNFLELVSLQWLNNLIRYSLFAGGAFLIFWKWRMFPSFRRLYPMPQAQQIKKELFYSIRTTALFLIPTGIIIGLTEKGMTKIYLDLADHSLGWYFLVFPVIFFTHETYFYWTHRFMHHSKVFPYLHSIHHESKDPSPLAAFSFDCGEALVQSFVFILISVFIPTHYSHIFFFTIFSLGMNVYGHLGVEVLSDKCQKKTLLKSVNTPTSHSLHHKKYKGNYGLYVNWWDKWMKTEIVATKGKD